MKYYVKHTISAVIFILATALAGCAQSGAAQTSSARAAYGTPAPFKAHVKKNKKTKKKALKSARRRKVATSKEPYRRLPM
jgi:type IV pilus biogenesis protein CpaD/CtpE